MTMITCACCGKEHTNQDKPGWWHLSNYFGLFGSFCGRCFVKVSHNAYRVPNHPRLYAEIKERLDCEREPKKVVDRKL